MRFFLLILVSIAALAANFDALVTIEKKLLASETSIVKLLSDLRKYTEWEGLLSVGDN